MNYRTSLLSVYTSKRIIGNDLENTGEYFERSNSEYGGSGIGTMSDWREFEEGSVRNSWYRGPNIWKRGGN